MTLRNALLLFALAITLPLSADVSDWPNPGQLKADWWTYFEPELALNDEQLQQRIDATLQGIKLHGDTFDAETKVSVLSAATQLDTLFKAYSTQRNETTSLTPSLNIPLERYTLEEAFTRYSTHLDLLANVEFDRDELEWRQGLVTAQKEQLSQRKLIYLEGSPLPTDRFIQGLAIIQSRLQMEIHRFELRGRKAQLAELVNRKTASEKEIKSISGRLSFSADDTKFWKKKYEDSLASIARINSESIASEARKLGLKNDAKTHDRRFEALLIIYRDLRIATDELRGLRAELVVKLASYSTGDRSQTADIESHLRKVNERINALAPKRKYWRNAVAGMAAARNTDLENTFSTALTDKHRQAIQLLRERANISIQEITRELKILEFSESVASDQLNQGKSSIEQAWLATKRSSSESIDYLSTLSEASLFEVNETPVTSLGLVRVVFILFVAWGISRIARRTISVIAAKRNSVSQSSLYTFGRVIHYIILMIGSVIALSSIGVDLTKFALLASALSIGIGFGLQTLVSNFVAGLIILFEKSMKVGDFVELESGLTGEVQEINMRSTLITTNDNIDILVPNSEFVNKHVTNWTMREAYRRLRIPFGVAYGTDKELVKKAGLEAAAEVNWTLDTEKKRMPQVWLTNFGDSSLDFELVVWLKPEAVNRPGSVIASYLWSIETKLGEYNIEIPFPQRDLHLRSGVELLEAKQSPI